MTVFAACACVRGVRSSFCTFLGGSFVRDKLLEAWTGEELTVRLAGTTEEGVFGSSTGITRVVGGGNSEESLWEKIHCWRRVQEFRWGHCIELKRPRVGNMTISWWSVE